METAIASRLVQPKYFWRSALLRGAGFWGGLRVTLPLLVLGTPGSDMRDAVVLRPSVSMLIVAIAAGLAWVHSIVMKERVFLGNMGIGRMAVMVPACAAGVLEMLTRVVIAWVFR